MSVIHRRDGECETAARHTYNIERQLAVMMGCILLCAITVVVTGCGSSNDTSTEQTVDNSDDAQSVENSDRSASDVDETSASDGEETAEPTTQEVPPKKALADWEIEDFRQAIQKTDADFVEAVKQLGARTVGDDEAATSLALMVADIAKMPDGDVPDSELAVLRRPKPAKKSQAGSNGGWVIDIRTDTSRKDYRHMTRDEKRRVDQMSPPLR
jgi:hypothetical protein